MWNYITTLLFFFVVFFVWFFLGFTASHAFPIDLIQSLTNYLFSGFQAYQWQLNKAVDHSLNSIWQEVRAKLHHTPTSESVIATADKREASQLNQLDSEYWLLLRAIELLTVGVNTTDRDLVDWKLTELDEQRDFILDRLNPLKRKHYGLLNKIQDTWHSCYAIFTFEAIRREKSFKRIEKILTDLLITYINQEPSKENIEEMLEVLDEKMAKNPRLKTLFQTSRLLNWVYSCIGNLSMDVNEDPIYKDYPVRAKRGRYCYHLPNGCSHYPRVEKPEHQAKILFFKTIKEAEAQNLDLCGTCKRIISSE
ncbi:hypothetical protein NIES2100_34750 [Calothrix sp. NIES-2100]|uniref:hypothetical protein n=1 Tax=Calothrix sp. NIES-2100 TaxID=1954172 RepID=UPI000B60D2A0|nr:hypothetical protein NIES2100_34750 [Calothrix sp. NIES-2100]